MEHPILSRSEALDLGKTHFFTGKPCKHGHTSLRFASTGTCVECNRERMRQFSSDFRKAKTARLRGHFSYPLHADDHAAALAYCQALDMQRGLTPKVPVETPRPDAATPEQLAAERRRIFGIAADYTALDQWGVGSDKPLGGRRKAATAPPSPEGTPDPGFHFPKL